MATRLHLSASPCSLDPPRHTSWFMAGTQPIRAMLAMPLEDALPLVTTSFNNLEQVTTNPIDVHFVTWLTKPLAAQTISGTFKGQLKMYQLNALADHVAQLLVRVIGPDGAHRAVLLPLHTLPLAGNELPTTIANRTLPGGALASYTCEEGDLIAIEFGVRTYNTSTASYTAVYHAGGTIAADLPEDNTTTAANLPWVEFSADLAYTMPTAQAYGIETLIGEPVYPDPPADTAGQPEYSATGQLWPR